MNPLLNITNKIIHNNNTSIRFKVYAPDIFIQLHQYYGINDKDVYNNYYNILLQTSYQLYQSNSKGAIRTGTLFFHTTPPTKRTTNNTSKAATNETKTTCTLDSKISTTTNNNNDHQKHNEYMIKTITSDDEKKSLLNDFLPKYYQYMKLYGTKTLLTRIYGIYEITFDDDNNNKLF